MKFFQIAGLVLWLLKYSWENNTSDDLQFRITGGKLVDPNKYYPVVSIQKILNNGNYMHICGGTVINDNQILSAAHCFIDGVPDKLRVVAGTFDIVEVKNKSLIHMVEKIVSHKQYDKDMLSNDIAIVYLKNNISNDILERSRIPLQRDEIHLFVTCYILGWGSMFMDGPWERYLRIAEIESYPMGYCISPVYAFFMGIDTTELICAGSYNGVDSCSGDSGGPLIYNDKLSGIVSYGFGDNCGHRPGIYTKVSTYYDWIISGRANKNLLYNNFLQILLVMWIVTSLNLN